MFGIDDLLVGLGMAGGSSALSYGSSAFQSYLNNSLSSKQAARDWRYYSTKYAPLQQQMQKDLFDYTSASNYDRSLSYIGDSKNALVNAGYNPILAVNGGASLGVGNLTGTVGSVGSVHSSSSPGVSAPDSKLNLQDFINLGTSAKQMDLIDAQKKEVEARTKETDARTIKLVEDTKKPGLVGESYRSLADIVETIGNHTRETWTSAMSWLDNMLHPVEPVQLPSHTGRDWQYDDKRHRSIYAPVD